MIFFNLSDVFAVFGCLEYVTQDICSRTIISRGIHFVCVDLIKNKEIKEIKEMKEMKEIKDIKEINE